MLRQARRIDPRPGDDDHPQLRHVRLGLRERLDHTAEQVPAHARPADGDDADLLARPVAELGPQLLPVGDGLEPGHVAGEVVVLLRPVADPREAVPERVGDDVVGVADEHRPVADPGEAGDVLDHLGVVVGGQERLVLTAVVHRQPADEVRQPDVRRRLQLRVLVQEVVDLPGLVADPEVVVLLAHEVEEEHEVGDEDLVHPPDRLEGMQVVLGRLALDVRRLVREQRARRVDPLPLRLEHGRHRVLGEPVDLEVGVQLPQLLRDRDVAPRVPEPDRRRDVERAPTPAERPRPGLHLRRRRRDRLGELAQQAVHLHRVARLRQVAGALERDERAAASARRRQPHARGSGSCRGRRGSRARGSGRARRWRAPPPRSPTAAAPPRRRGSATPRRPRAPSGRSPRSASSSAAPGSAARRRTRGSRW